MKIKHLIVHKVDHHTLNQPRLSDLECPFDDSVAEFLIKHIEKSKNHHSTRNAQFIDNSPDGVNSLAKTCREMLKAPATEFIEGSKTIASMLFDVVSRDQRISPSDLIVCLYEASSEMELAILKMVPEDGFVTNYVEDQGQHRFELQLVKDVLPTSGIQKCALVSKERNPVTHHDLKVLDHQVTRHGVYQPLVASFFLDKFLQCQMHLTAKDKTDLFFDKSLTWLKTKEESWSYGDYSRFEEKIISCLQDNEISVTDVANAVIKIPEERDEYIDNLTAVGLDLKFKPDKARAQKHLEYVKFKGDDGLEIRIKASAVGPNKTLEEKYDQASEKHVVTIRTKLWEKTRR